MKFEIDATFKSFLDQLYLSVLIIDKSGRIVYYNQKHGEMDELTPEDTLGYKISEAYSNSEDDSPAVMALRSGQPVTKLLTYKTARGKKFTTHTHSYPLWRQGEVIGAINVVTDVSSMMNATLPLTEPPKAKRQEGDPRVDFDSLIGKSPLFREAIDVAKVAADGPSPVMLIGETSTGKDLFARAEGKYIAINCSAIPEALLEGILFGATKGALNRGIIRREAAHLGWSPQLTRYRMNKYKLKSEDFKGE